MQITFDTHELTALDRQVLAVFAGDAKPAPAPKAEAAPAAKKAAAKKPEPVEAEVVEEEDEDLLGEGPTLSDAVAKATDLVAAGKANDVKKVLSSLGVKRVSELGGDQIQAFLDGLS